MSKNNLPALAEIVQNPNLVFKQNDLKKWTNQEPPEAWVKTNKYADNSKYVPIDKVEMFMDMLFQQWRVEVLDVKQLFNSISTTVRLHYLDPTNNTWTFHDGVGAKAIQTNKGSGILMPDFSNAKEKAIEMALPISKTQAIKDAADHIGKIFGRDLNRKDATSYRDLIVKMEKKPTLEPKTDKWQMAIKALSENNATIEQIEKKYELTEYNRDLLMSESLEHVA